MNNLKLRHSTIIRTSILLLSALFFLYFIFTMEWVNGGADSFSHFLINRYSFQHPELFLHHWGKPFFTLISSPFAQFGMKGMEVFNLLCLLTAAYLSSKICTNLEYTYSILAIIMTLFAPIVFIHVFSGITEPFGALLLTFGVYLLSISKFRNACLVFSFLLFVRNESLVFLPLLFLYLIWINKGMYAFYLLSAPVLYSILGSFHYGSLFWIVEQFPYTGAKEIYNSGSLFSFLDSYQSITHLAVGIAFVLGFISLGIKWVKDKSDKWNTNSQMELFILLIIIGYFSAHSVVWWLGIGGSLGLTRVMILIVPLIAIIGVLGLNKIAAFLPEKLQMVFYLVFGIIVIYIPIEREELPKEIEVNDALVQLTLSKVELKEGEKKIGYFHPLVPYCAKIDPFRDDVSDLIFHGNSLLSQFNTGDVVIWDSHFGKNEGKTELDFLLQDFDIVASNKKDEFEIVVLVKK